MGKIVEKKKKKKGRPSLLDIQKRTLREQQQQQQNQPQPQTQTQTQTKPNPNSIHSDPNTRFDRRNGIATSPATIFSQEGDEVDEDDSNTKQGDKKFKFVLRLPPQRQNSRSLDNSHFLQNVDGVSTDNLLKKRRINGIQDRSAHQHGEKEEKDTFASKSDAHSGTPMDADPTTPLPDKKLLVFILDRLQKKDTYGVFSEPVDPKELPDYHEIVEHPMDFGTVRKKLSSGAYTHLEHFEKDVFLICSNAMKYNAPDTIYFRQARSIQELAKKDFENLRQESDDNESQPKVVRRGRPPTKNLKKRLGRPPNDRTGSELSSNASLANAGDDNIGSSSYDLRRGPFSGKSGPADASGRLYHGSRNHEGFAWSASHNSEPNNDFPASMLKGMSMKLGMKHFVLDENRRNTYNQSHPLDSRCSPSVLGTFDGETKQLMAVGLHMEHGFARSLARYAASLGPIAWKIASKKIERALPAGVKFGPGWVGESETPSLQSSPIFRASQQPASHQEDLLEKQEPSNDSESYMHLNRTNPSPAVATFIGNASHDPAMDSRETIRGLKSESRVGLLNGNSAGIRLNPPTIHEETLLDVASSALQNPVLQMNQLVRTVLPGAVTSSASIQLEMLDSVARTGQNDVPVTENHAESEGTNLSGCSSTVNSDTSSVDPLSEAQGIVDEGLEQSESSYNQKSDSVPPDLNIRFQSSLSPAATAHPDLVLQL